MTLAAVAAAEEGKKKKKRMTKKLASSEATNGDNVVDALSAATKPLKKKKKKRASVAAEVSPDVLESAAAAEAAEGGKRRKLKKRERADDADEDDDGAERGPKKKKWGTEHDDYDEMIKIKEAAWKKKVEEWEKPVATGVLGSGIEPNDTDFYNYVDLAGFESLGLAPETMRAIKEEFGFESMTRIQQAAIPVALRGNSVLGIAETGSGKTLAFLIPVVEMLVHQNSDTKMFSGLFALILAPARELVLQITRELNKVRMPVT